MIDSTTVSDEYSKLLYLNNVCTGVMIKSAASVHNPQGKHRIALVCEHASALIPDHLNGLGLTRDALQSHIAWDPGALLTAQFLSQKLDAVLVAGEVSRLVYDCNRPPESPTAIVEKSEAYTIPGNTDLTIDDRQSRVDSVYTPFTTVLSNTLQAHQNPIVLTIHSFTPIYNGVTRKVEIGVLHDDDSVLADAMLSCSPSQYRVERNAPYGPVDGVTHTLKLHALAYKRLNAMLEIRNDLIASEEACEKMAATLSVWIEEALANMSMAGEGTEAMI